MYANSSSTSDKDFTATYTVDDRNAKKCEVEARITVRFSRGSLNVAYSYDGEEFSTVKQTPLNNDKTLSFKYDETTDGYAVSKDPENGEWVDKSTKLTFPDSFAGKPVTIIDQTIFSGCTKLKSISIPSSVVDLGNDGNMFDNCPIEEASVSAKFIGRIPKARLKSVKIVGDYALEGYTLSDCESLTSVELSEDISGIARNAFRGSDNLKYTEYGNAYYLGNTKNPYLALVFTKTDDVSYVDINERTKIICDSAFENCSNLIWQIVIPDGVKIIGKNAFSSCRNLANVTIPDSVTKIGEGAFSFLYSSSNNYTDRVDNINANEYGGALYLGNEKNPYAALVGTKYRVSSVEMHPSTKVIRDELFAKSESLTSVKIDGVTSIKDGTFRGCKNLTSVTISDSVTSIGEQAFEDCSSLKSVTIPRGVTSIGWAAFSGCKGLTSVTIPDTVTSIGSCAFMLCSSLTGVVIPNEVTTIGSNAFYDCKSLTRVTIPDNVTSIGYNAFVGCDNLNYNEYGNARYLGSAQNPYFALIRVVNTNINSVDINENTKIIANSAFKDCERLESVTIPGSVKSVGDQAFYDCRNITSVTVLSGVTEIGSGAFAGCEKLYSITIPKSVTSIGSAIFGWGKFITVTYEGTMKEWSYFALDKGVVAQEGYGRATIKCSDGEMYFDFY